MATLAVWQWLESCEVMIGSIENLNRRPWILLPYTRFSCRFPFNQFRERWLSMTMWGKPCDTLHQTKKGDPQGTPYDPIISSCFHACSSCFLGSYVPKVSKPALTNRRFFARATNDKALGPSARKIGNGSPGARDTNAKRVAKSTNPLQMELGLSTSRCLEILRLGMIRVLWVFFLWGPYAP